MTFEADLYVLLQVAAPDLGTRVYPDFAAVDTPRPYCTFQQIGGEVINPIGNVAPGKRNAYMQVNVWADTRLQALEISRAIEDAMRAATSFQARPMASVACDFDADIPVYAARQDFTCWHGT
jgi:hypothetical protein